MPGRDIGLPTTRGRRGPIKTALFVVAGVAVVLASWIAIGARIAPPESSTRTVTERAALPARAATAPGRPAHTAVPHTRLGAAAAAARSVTAFSGNVLLEPGLLHRVVSRIASDASRPRLLEAFAEASAQARAELGADTVPRPAIVLRAVPVGYRIERYSPERATVAVWYVGIVGSGATVQPQQSWRTETVDLVWEHAAWKVDWFASSAGPTPALAAGQAEAPGALFAAILRFRGFAYGSR